MNTDTCQIRPLPNETGIGIPVKRGRPKEVHAMEKNNLDLIALLQRVPSATVTLQLSDLNTFSRRLIAETRNEYEKEITDRITARKETYLTAEVVKETVKVSDSTLWRWAKAGMLVPVMVGGQKRYRQSDIDRLVENGL